MNFIRIFVLLALVGGMLQGLREARRLGRPLSWTFWACVGFAVSAAALVFFRESTSMLTAASVVTIMALAYAFSVYARESPTRET